MVRHTSQAPYDKFKRCLQALIQDGQDGGACTDAGELCCANCSGGNLVAESLSAFCCHSDAARSYFARNGGMDALQLALNSHDESRALPALQVLHAFAICPQGQRLVTSTCPSLLAAVVDASAGKHGGDAVRSQHAALSLLLLWLQSLHPASPSGPPAQEGIDPTTWLAAAISSLHHPSLATRKAAALLFSHIASPPGAPPPPAEPPPPSVHDTLSPPGATPPRPEPPCPSPPEAAAIRHLHTLCAAAGRALLTAVQLSQPWAEEAPSTSAPGMASMPSDPLSPEAFFQQEDAVSVHRTALQALLEVSCALAGGGPRAARLLYSAGVPSLMLQAFCMAWQLRPPHEPAAVAAVACAASAGCCTTTPTYLQEGSVQEQCLDALLLLLRQPRAVELLPLQPPRAGEDLPCGHRSQGIATAGATARGADVTATGACAGAVCASGLTAGGDACCGQGPAGQEAGCSGGQGATAADLPAATARLHEEQGLSLLSSLVLQLLLRPTPTRIRAALALLGSTHFGSKEGAPGPGGGGDRDTFGPDEGRRVQQASAATATATASNADPGGIRPASTAADTANATAAAVTAAAAATCSGATASRGHATPAQVAWLDTLCHIFDAAWSAEASASGGGPHAPSPHVPAWDQAYPPSPNNVAAPSAHATAATARCAPEAAQGAEATPDPGRHADAATATAAAADLGRHTGEGTGAVAGAVAGGSAYNQQPGSGPGQADMLQPPNTQRPPTGPDAPATALATALPPTLVSFTPMQIELGLGYRVLAQVGYWALTRVGYRVLAQVGFRALARMGCWVLAWVGYWVLAQVAFFCVVVVCLVD